MAEITLYNQDCIAAMKQIDAESIDLIVTDPPYNLGNFMKKRDTNLKKMRDNFFGSAGWDDMEFDEWSKSMDEFFKASASHNFCACVTNSFSEFSAVFKQITRHFLS